MLQKPRTGGSLLDRPDIARQCKPSLTFFEVNDLLIKFFMQSGLSFSGKEQLSILTEYIHRKGTSEEEVFYLKSQNEYTVTGKLKGILINNKPVYVVALSGTLSTLSNRHSNKLLKAKEQYNIIIFDENDWRRLGVDISDKRWIKPLNKKTMKTLAKLLFDKISELKGEVESECTLNDIYNNIDFNASIRASQSLLDKLSEEVFKLKCELRYEKLSNQDFKVSNKHMPIIKELTKLNEESLEWIENIVGFCINSGIRVLNFKNNKHRDYFRNSSGKVCLTDKENYAYYLCDLFKKKRKANIVIENLGYGLLKVKNTKTLQNIVLAISVSSSPNRLFSINKSTFHKLKPDLIFNIHLVVKKTSKKVSEVLGFVVLRDYSSKKLTFTSEYKLPVYKQGIYSLWSKINHDA